VPRDYELNSLAKHFTGERLLCPRTVVLSAFWCVNADYLVLHFRPSLEPVITGKGVLDFTETESGRENIFVGLAVEAVMKFQDFTAGDISAPVSTQDALGLLLEVNEAGGGRQLAGHDDLLSYSRPAPAISGRKKVSIPVSQMKVDLALAAGEVASFKHRHKATPAEACMSTGELGRFLQFD
jgi:hypothetical protein